MKKKHLRSLQSLEKWLHGHNALSDALVQALEALKTGILALPEVEEHSSAKLPPPLEISQDPMTIALYTDGGCRGNPGPGAFAYVVQEHSGEILAEGVDYERLTTNNKMELSAPLRGLQELIDILPPKGRDPLLTKIKVITDSNYVVQGMNSWVHGWKSRGWKKADNKTPENLELWQALDEVRKHFMHVDWMWVRGHAGHPQNEYCDRKANELMDENQS